MEYEDLKQRIARLRYELQQIGLANRWYFSQGHHYRDEIDQHERRRDRVVEIKLELETLIQRKPD